ncbi:hypothetical protein [Sporosarcina highlanderae]|uniref:Lipoprotein n=1 Tax=Sporosarcina highlanderae TaxID=3035916 RepID=A0ABT8JR92_9BACL|nr:hypothetical protein [Sporosarcina highlanderae]MDN4607675.1 hypothetical protein [Sporosarcina highlanderae]
MQLKMKEIPHLKIKALIIFFTLIAISACSKPNASHENAPGTPKVSIEQAEKVALDEYGLSKIETMNLRLLTESEMKNLNEEQLKFTQVYYVVKGLKGSREVTVYVSTNQIDYHFFISDDSQ